MRSRELDLVIPTGPFQLTYSVIVWPLECRITLVMVEDSK